MLNLLKIKQEDMKKTSLFLTSRCTDVLSINPAKSLSALQDATQIIQLFLELLLTDVVVSLKNLA